MVRRSRASHDFSELINDVVFDNGTSTMIRNYYSVPKPGLTNDMILYRYPGSINGHSGFYEIGVRPSVSGNTEVVIHRFFRPNY